MASIEVAKKESTPPPWMRRFFTLWAGQAFSLLGSALVQWALMFWVAVTTASPLDLAIAGAMGLLPQVFLSPFAGAYVDRHDRKKVMLFADLLTALGTLILMLLFVAQAIALWHIFIVMFFRSAMQAFHWPAMQASTALMVPKDHLARITGLNQSVMGLTSIMGPALGAFLYVALPMYLVLGMDVVTAAMAITALLVVRIPEIRKPKGREKTPILRDLVEAFRYVQAWKGALLVVAVFSVVNFLITPAFTFFNLLTLYHFGQGPYQAAFMDVMLGAGMITGGLILGMWGGSKRKIVTCIGALASSGGGVLLIGVLPPDGFLIAATTALFIGTGLSIVNGIVMAILQKGIRADMQGRVFALLSSLSSGMAPLGLALSGPFAAVFGIQAWFIAGGLIMVVVSASLFFVPVVLNIEDHIAEAVAIEQ
ncbi:MAG: MFS transporter [Methanomassiliicoccus sp.]|nr:MFS transporter [Methanomassiliicoccus sp.]